MAKKNSEPPRPPKNKTTYTGPRGGTYTITNGVKEYYGNNGR